MTKIYNVYVNGELATNFSLEEEMDFANREILSVLESKNPQFVDITEYPYIPSSGMIFKDGEFLEGKDEERFVGDLSERISKIKTQYESLDMPRLGPPNIKIVACLDDKVFKQYMIYDINIQGIEGTYAALMSNPTIERVQ